ncbi:MAG: flagellar biosynthetic protein FliO [Planctomycetes bacterium]|nr:flagellar biosynthetic protein FliO [Planctomycetota bacterium]
MSKVLLCVSPLPSLEQAAGLGGTSGPDLTRYLAVCAGLIALVVVLGLVFRKLVGRALTARAAQRSMQVIDMLPLGGKQRLAVVRCYDRTFLLGLGDKEIASIAELDAVITPKKEGTPLRADLQSFSNVLSKLRAKPAAQPAQKEGILA